MFSLKKIADWKYSSLFVVAATILSYYILGSKVTTGITAIIGTLLLLPMLIPVSIYKLIIKSSKSDEIFPFSTQTSLLVGSLVAFFGHGLMAVLYFLNKDLSNLGRLDILPGLIAMLILLLVNVVRLPTLRHKLGTKFERIQAAIWSIPAIGLVHSILSSNNYEGFFPIFGLVTFSLFLFLATIQSILIFKTPRVNKVYLVSGITVSFLIIFLAVGVIDGISLDPISEVKNNSAVNKSFVDTYIDNPVKESGQEKNLFFLNQAQIAEEDIVSDNMINNTNNPIQKPANTEKSLELSSSSSALSKQDSKSSQVIASQVSQSESQQSSVQTETISESSISN